MKRVVSAEYNYGAKEETRSLYKEGRVSTLPVIALYAIVYDTWPLYSYVVMLKKGAPETPVLRTGYRNVTPPAAFINDEMSLKDRAFLGMEIEFVWKRFLSKSSYIWKIRYQNSVNLHDDKNKTYFLTFPFLKETGSLVSSTSRK